jgi:hypothetical protein
MKSVESRIEKLEKTINEDTVWCPKIICLNDGEEIPAHLEDEDLIIIKYVTPAKVACRPEENLSID